MHGNTWYHFSIPVQKPALLAFSRADHHVTTCRAQCRDWRELGLTVRQPQTYDGRTHALGSSAIPWKFLLILDTIPAASTSAPVRRRPIEKILVANRGEIACRVFRSARKLGIRSVAVFSDADRKAMHVTMADEAYHIGPAASQESYLRQDRILDVAKRSGAQAIHPGYGFLSENTEFAERCAAEGIIFVGPPASAIRDMGIKSTSKAIMSAAKVPIIEGYHGEEQSETRLKEEARRIGFPVMAKAVRGGGGKGMRIVMNEDEFDSQLESAKREAMKSFGDDAMLIEKFVADPSIHVHCHCEMKRNGAAIVYLQPGVTEETRRLLGEAAVRAAQAVNYVGAGTVEFIMDSEQRFYFMEMNTRLQVEHPITEMITGTDLVEWQIKVAQGEPLPLRQEQLRVHGHAFEARIYAEDPDNNFMPGAGSLVFLRTPATSEQVRIDTGVREGDDVSVHYDPMIAKLAVWGPDRPTALRRLHQSLSEFTLVGLANNVSFLMRLAAHPAFRQGVVHTGFIPTHNDELFVRPETSQPVICAAVLSLLAHERAETLGAQARESFQSLNLSAPFRVNSNCKRKVLLTCRDKKHEVLVTFLNAGSYLMRCGDEAFQVLGRAIVDRGVAHVECEVQGTDIKIRTVLHDGTLHVFTADGLEQMSVPVPAYLENAGGSSGTGKKGAVAPMPGVVEKLFVNEGDTVAEGDPLVVMIAMKMEYVIKAATAGVVEKLLYKAGDNVAKNAELVKIRAAEIS
ncbi:hypothetical protein HPB49_025153 [Dermacentor silvarum]|uniref:Uncharacterized protein n=1 Tax=Dermacentor silvarum TaxID=543639 RepID=A0ACB8DHK9_DERSI|nr:hypothetical protein HPB49_025153 [Dermacentor silvarum]